MIEELNSINRNNTWELTELSARKKPIDVKWIFKLKLKPIGEVAKHKARLVDRGFMEKPGMDYFEVYAQVARLETVRLIVAIACGRNWPMYNLDVKFAFLNGPLDEEVYVTQPPCFKIKGKEDTVYRLNKSLYGLKQAPRAWNKRIDNFLVQQEFVKHKSEYGVYVKKGIEGNQLIICLYVDDLIVTGSDVKEIEVFETQMMNEFEMSDLGNLTYFLGMEFTEVAEGLVMHQMKYASDILKRFIMMNCNPSSSPAETNMKLVMNEEEEHVDPTLFKQIVGSLRYLCNSKSHIAYAVGIISRFMSGPRASHLLVAKRVMRYIKGTLQYDILFPKCLNGNSMELIAYSGADWCGDKQDWKSTSWHQFKFLNAPISWCAKTKLIVALSTCESEYIAGCMAVCQAVWLENILKGMEIEVKILVALFIDNKSAISLARNRVLHGRSKHRVAKFHFLREQVNKGSTELQLADIFTKPLKVDKFIKLRSLIGMNEVKN